METFRRLIEAIEAEGAAALITLAETAGSAPREAGARMVVRPSGGMYGTIGGGELEYEAVDEARAALAAGRGPARRRSVGLGPELGQCCGGRVVWRVETFDQRDLADARAAARGRARRPVRRAGAARRRRPRRSAASATRLRTASSARRSARRRRRSICSAPATSAARWC